MTHEDLLAADVDGDGRVDEVCGSGAFFAASFNNDLNCDTLLATQAEFVLFKLRQMGVVSEEDITLCRQLFQHLVSHLPVCKIGTAA